LPLYQLYLVDYVQLEAGIISGQRPWSQPRCDRAWNHLLLLLFWLVLLILLALLALLALLLLLLLLISRPRKGGIFIVITMSRLTGTLLLRRIPGALLLTPGSSITPATTGQTCPSPGRHILASMHVADILVALADILLNNSLLSGNGKIINLNLLVLASGSHTSSTPSAGMRGRGFAPQPRVGTYDRRNILGCPGTWVCLLKGLLLLGSFRQ
jgi:hypothetical protein